MRRNLAVAIVAVLALSPGGRAGSQWRNGNLAIRTNGNTFRSGDRLKVEALALEKIDEPFYTEVSYEFTEPVKETDKKGKETTRQELRTRARQPGPTLESLDQFRSALLDDTFNFGEGSPAGRYTIVVAVFRGFTKERVATLRSCVFYRDSRESLGECAPFLRGLKRVGSDEWLIFEGSFSERGRYSATLLAGANVVSYLEVGVYTSGPRELNLSSHLLAGAGGRTLDILIHDHEANCSSTLARVAIPSGG